MGHMMKGAILTNIFQLTYHGDERMNERTNFSRRIIENESRKRNQKAIKKEGWMSRACKGVECSRYEPHQRQDTESDISMAQNESWAVVGWLWVREKGALSNRNGGRREAHAQSAAQDLV
jgi:hypothetical protein